MSRRCSLPVQPLLEVIGLKVRKVRRPIRLRALVLHRYKMGSVVLMVPSAQVTSFQPLSRLHDTLVCGGVAYLSSDNQELKAEFQTASFLSSKPSSGTRPCRRG